MTVPRNLAWALAAMLVSCRGGAALPANAPAVTVKARSFRVTTLATEQDRRRATDGLRALQEGDALLLAWPRERYVKVESKDARASFDAVFLDRAGKVVDVQPLKEGDPEGIMSRAEAAFALLVNPGGATSVGVGDMAQLPPVRARELPVLTIADATAFVELALTDEDRQHGLMFRPRMSADDGMLFCYPGEDMRGFWMKNTLIPLDIAFFASDGTLVNVNETPMFPDPRQPPANYDTANSAAPARFVLEMNLGWFKRKGLVDAQGKPKPGLKAVLPPEALKGSFD